LSFRISIASDEVMNEAKKPALDSPSYYLHRLVALLDRGAEKILQSQLGVSYRRCLFLVVIQEQGPLTQHELAVCLGYTDPAVSAMLVELSEDELVSISTSPEHKRKRIVTLSPRGTKIVTAARRILDEHFAELLDAAGVDSEHYGQLTERIYRTLLAKTGQA
jgi:DNA-binding MarR family transcriptional regulator